MSIGIWILGDQLNPQQAALQSISSQETPIILIESLQHIKIRQYHKQKLVFIWSAMRHFAAELRQQGYNVTYAESEDFFTPLITWIQQHQITELRLMTPADIPFKQVIQHLEAEYLSRLNCRIYFLPNNHFLWQPHEFKKWAKSRKNLVMEYFYREGRKRFNILIDGGKPVGGEWNYDKENRQPPKGKLNTPPVLQFTPDSITQTVINKVNHLHQLNIQTYGEIKEFTWAVNRSQALEVLDFFVNVRLTGFGTYQDAMVTGEKTMWHSLISPYLNNGLLHPLEVIQTAQTAFFEHNLPLNSVEGFIRQVLGWREYMYGLYHYLEPESYSQKNFFHHTQSLPEFFWTGKTKMNCLHQVFSQLEFTGYAHHIQRLMVLSNFCLIAGFSPQEVENWFHATFIDAYDWVMQTNVIGMGLFADGGILASKPYAASANYINKMSDYCKNCSYDYKTRIGEKACPFNFFYWDFLDRHRDKLVNQGRMSFILKNLDKMSDEEITTIRTQAKNWHQQYGNLV